MLQTSYPHTHCEGLCLAFRMEASTSFNNSGLSTSQWLIAQGSRREKSQGSLSAARTRADTLAKNIEYAYDRTDVNRDMYRLKEFPRLSVWCDTIDHWNTTLWKAKSIAAHQNLYTLVDGKIAKQTDRLIPFA
ncbi:hypothetical protein L6452_06129 [Arctium lappa]|uniref:Uncharacterized protein n=1 Tax=Arctium lappa TaxID=4217 RepID=A0ACB9EJD5_ARCLA|nr:hypothetical protein L6452_06129 [Arctium lappa]